MAQNQRGRHLPLHHFCSPLPWEATVSLCPSTFFPPYVSPVCTLVFFSFFAVLEGHFRPTQFLLHFLPPRGPGRLPRKPLEPAPCSAAAANQRKTVQRVKILPTWQLFLYLLQTLNVPAAMASRQWRKRRHAGRSGTPLNPAFNLSKKGSW